MTNLGVPVRSLSRPSPKARPSTSGDYGGGVPAERLVFRPSVEIQAQSSHFLN